MGHCGRTKDSTPPPTEGPIPVPPLHHRFRRSSAVCGFRHAKGKHNCDRHTSLRHWSRCCTLLVGRRPTAGTDVLADYASDGSGSGGQHCSLSRCIWPFISAESSSGCPWRSDCSWSVVPSRLSRCVSASRIVLDLSCVSLLAFDRITE